jgi:hypothetical protein
VHACLFPVTGSNRAVMPRFCARTPVRRGVECAFRASAAVDVLFRAGLEGWWAKRSGLGLLVDFIVRTVVCEGVGSGAVGARGIRQRVVDRRRRDEGRSPQLRGALGGIALVFLRSVLMLKIVVWRF